MKTLITAFFVFLASPIGASEETSLVDQGRGMLLAEDFAGLEKLLEKAHEDALDRRDHAALRKFYRELFEKPETRRFEHTKAWVDAFPESEFALTALAVSLIERSGLVRGSATRFYTHPKALESFAEGYKAAHMLLKRANATGSTFVPNLDALIRIELRSVDKANALALAKRLFELAPDRQSIALTRHVLSPNWGGKPEDVLEFCATYAPKVKDYTSDACLIEAVFANRTEGPLRKAAIDALEDVESSILNHVLLDVYLREWRHRPEAAEKAIELHKEWLKYDFSPAEYFADADVIMSLFQRVFYVSDAKAAGLQALRKRIENAPLSYRLATEYIRLTFNEASRKGGFFPDEMTSDLYALWPNMLELGAYSPLVWNAGRQLAQGRDRFDFEAHALFAHNSIYFSNHNPHRVRNWMSSLYTLWKIADEQSDDASIPSGLRDALMCPMTRASMVYENICQTTPSASGCNVGGYAENVVAEVRRLTKSTDKCAAVKASSFKELMYEPTDISADYFTHESSNE